MNRVFSPVAVVPVYNHPQAIAGLVAAMRGHGLPCLLVDDGSGPECAAVLRELAAASPGDVSLLRLETNQGKGAAVMAGLREAGRRGFSHALQIDADGQHDPADVPRFLAMAREQPDAVVNGRPLYDRSVPRGRLYGRYLTHVWVWINTLSLDISDSMCGFRVYPLAPTLALLDSVRIGRRMDFDTEVLVRLHWRGIAVRDCPTRVVYPEGGVSHFRMLHDNLRISAMHTRLFFGMLLRLPRLLARKVAG
ncbi:glycosyltransferase family 2 protein [Arenimonas caeni]|jgi:glycosyltransferase involved in cell wall biosynthesis|uniref:glycosyltransferase family 2 protein n=1 Tax=Arenimonas caeni TaxID=2058085 RepID=UPI002A3697F0|nr:glycosyltransferase family 2 protein [Arenimonas caeni]MDY0021697.1 glycosyltransferase family 2 protein [Arenimonas caeni]